MIFCRAVSRYCRLQPDKIHEKLFFSDLVKKFDSGAFSPEVFFETARSALGLNIDIALFAYVWSNIFTLMQGIEPLIHRLKLHYRLLCLSNTNPWHYTWCRQHFKVLDAFDAFILSYERHSCKPDLKIYKEAIVKADSTPERCLYIDDSPDNVAAARLLNMQGIVFTSVDGLEQALLKNGFLQPHSSLIVDS